MISTFEYMILTGYFLELRQLDLQRNRIGGVLPATIRNLENLLYLNLKDNLNLGGKLPVNDLSQLTKLNRLSLVQCNFDHTEESVEELQQNLSKCKIWI
jgi:Leucine rich repeat